MDINVWAPILIALIAAIPGSLSLYNQGKKDKVQATIDMNASANAAAMGIIKPLQDEVARLQQRVAELEQSLIDKTNKIGELSMSIIDKDTELKTLRYKMDQMRLKLDTFVGDKKGAKATSERMKSRKEETVPLGIRDEIQANTEKKTAIAEDTKKEVEALQSKYAHNGEQSETPVEGE